MEENSCPSRNPAETGRLLSSAESERDQLPFRFNSPAVPYPHNQLLHTLFQEQATKTPDAVAIVCGERQLTYEQLNRRSNQVARILIKHGVQPDERVGVYVERGIEMVVGFLGVLKAGAAYVPLDPTYPQERLSFMCERSSLVALLTKAPLLQQWPNFQRPVIVFEDNVNQSSDNPHVAELTSRNLAYVIFTSGSTGRPKGVMIEHRSACNLVTAQTKQFDIRVDSRVLQCASQSFDACIWEMLMALCRGASLYIPPASVVLIGSNLLDFLRSYGITHVTLTPTVLQSVPHSTPLPFLRTIVVAGEPCPPSLVREWAPERQFINAYGPTEATVCATMFTCGAEEKQPAIGCPVANARVYILDSNGNPVPTGSVGEICIGGVSVARGYLDQPDLTAERFVPDPFIDDQNARLYRSGDLGTWRANGDIDYIGRSDLQTKISGFRVEPGEIEAALCTHQAVKQAAVMVRDNQCGDRQLSAYIVVDRAQVKASEQKRSADASTDFVNQWKQVCEDAYAGAMVEPSFVGWNSTYTGQPIPHSEMHEWLQNTVLQIESLNPTRVLEIGCGVGLLLQQLAPKCEAYHGIDFSLEALARLRHWLTTQPTLQHVRLEHCAAAEISGEPGQYDTVIINSVAQHFPDIAYLVSVLQRAVHLVRSGGHIFVGDVRNLSLLSLFHSSVQLERAAATVTIGQLKRRIARAVALDKQLVIDPRFFSELPHVLKGIGSAQTLLKRGKAHNELTRYRYDAVLQVGEPRQEAQRVTRNWSVQPLSPADLESIMLQTNAPVVQLHGIRSQRLHDHLAAAILVEQSEEALTVGELKVKLRGNAAAGEDPELFWDSGEARGYQVRVAPTSGSEEGAFDVEWIDPARIHTKLHASQTHETPSIDGAALNGTTAAYANDPWGASLGQELVLRLRQYLKDRLPPFMLPSEITILETMPVTENGKLDRSALPLPALGGRSGNQYEPPCGDVEEIIALIWEELLQVEQISRDDDFFDLGGNSMTAIKLLTTLAEQFSLDLHVQTIFRNATVRQMAEFVTERLSKKEQEPYSESILEGTL